MIARRLCSQQQLHNCLTDLTNVILLPMVWDNSSETFRISDITRWESSEDN